MSHKWTSSDITALQMRNKPTAPKDADIRHETELQRDITRLLDQRGIFFARSRMDKRTSVRVGLFDFTVFLPDGRFLAVEAKVKGGSVKPEQQTLFAEFASKTGQQVHVVWNLQEFKQLLDGESE